MTTYGWMMMTGCWAVIIVLSAFLVYKTIANPRHEDE